MRRTVARTLLGALVVSLLTAPAGAQVRPQGTADQNFPCTSASPDARALMQEALFEQMNVQYVRARTLAKRALAADPTLGLARAMAATDPALTRAQRLAELERALSDAARASAAEQLFIMGMREQLLGRRREMRVLIDAMVAMQPDDPISAQLQAQNEPDPMKHADMFEALTRKFPTYAAGWNMAGYMRSWAGDREGGVKAGAEYVRLLPDHPSSVHSYGQMLQWAGRLPEAMEHFQRSHRLNHSDGYGYAMRSIGEIHLLMGRPREAREAFLQEAMEHASASGRLTAEAWASSTHLFEGNDRLMIREFTDQSARAERENLRAIAGNYHRSIAFQEALSGDRARIPVHLAKAAEFGAETFYHFYMTALAYAATDQIDLAKAAASKAHELAAKADDAARKSAHEMDAVIAAAEKDFDRAKRELKEAGIQPSLGQALVAQRLARAGRKAEAQELKAQVLGDYELTGSDLWARWIVQKL
jgi:tetratricopeptide (TPR) repeat protein